MFAGAFVLTITLLAGFQAIGVNAKHGSDDKIIYPGPIQDHTPAKTESRYGGNTDNDIPEECRNKNYCTIKPKDYPQEKFNRMFKSKNNWVEFGRWKRDAAADGNSAKAANETKIPITQPEPDVSDLVDKQGDPDDVDNCETQVEFEPLYRVKTNDNVWRTVVQAPEKNYVQSVRMETCRENDKPCFTRFPKLPTYTTFCKQKFTKWTFIVETLDKTGEEKLEVDLPTCCSCHYKHT